MRLLRDRFVPLSDEMALDAVAGAGETLSLFDMAAALRHLESAVAFLSRRPDAATQEAVREAVIAVAATVRSLRGPEASAGGRGHGAGGARDEAGAGAIALGTVAPVRDRLGICAELAGGIDAILARCHALSGLPGASPDVGPPDPAEAAFLVVFCASVIRFLVGRGGVAPACDGRR